MVTFLITLGILLFVNLLLFTFSVNKSDKKANKLVIEKNEQIIAHTQRFIPDVENSKNVVSKKESNQSLTNQSVDVLVSE